ncbi:chromosome segregation protein SMC [Candidatus Aminicenantes bacterium AC-334-K16]|jgi:chromosome segregation protein|nr:chromosome segregation protein SMC [Candidatus Aminicenantes bacterium AC-334-K16]
MHIKKIELQGFKSFPERTRIQFHPGITAIVGPNGTGKSNIVDALLFVLGEKKPKALRSEKKEDIIFNGNSSRPPLNMAEVTLYLVDDETDEELKISHRFFRSGESEFRLNGKVVRLKDIRDELWKRDIGEREYFIIEQGSINFFLQTKPTEKRLLIEEAAGTSFYKEKKRQAQQKLDNSEQNLARLEDIIEEVEKRVRSLQRQAQAARRYRRLRETIRQQTLQLFRQKIELLEEKRRDILNNYQAHLHQEKEWSAQLKEKETQSNHLQTKIWELEKKIQAGQSRVRKSQTSLTRLAAEKEKERRHLEFLAEKLRSLDRSQKELNREKKILTNQLEELEQQIHQTETALAQLQNQLQTATTAITKISEKVTAKQKKIDELRHQHLQFLAQLTETKNNLARQEKHLEFITNQIKKLGQEKEATRHELRARKENLDRLNLAKKSLQSKIDELNRKSTQLEEELHQARGELSKLEKKETELLTARQELHSKIKALEHLLEQLRSLGQSASPSGGVLADWLETRPEIARLVDTFWEVETRVPLVNPEDILAQKLSLPPTGTFLLIPPGKKRVLETAEQKSLSRTTLKKEIKISSPHPLNLDRLPDAVLVNSIEEAVSSWLNHPENNYLTRSGDILFSSGLLKIGQTKEGMVSLRLERQNLSREMEKISQEIKPLQEKITSTREKISWQEKEKNQLAGSLKEAERKKAALEKDLAYLQKEINRLEETLRIITREENILDQEKTTCETQIKSLKEKEAQLTQSVNQHLNQLTVENQMLEKLKKELAAEQSHSFAQQTQEQRLHEKKEHLHRQMKESRERLQGLEKKINNLAAEKDSLQEQRQSLKEKIKSFKDEITQTEAQLRQEEKELREIEEDHHRLLQEKKELSEQLRYFQEKFTASQEERMAWEIKKAEIERDLVNLEETSWQETRQTLEEIKNNVTLEKTTIPEIERTLHEAQERLQKMGGVNLVAEEEYNQEKERLDFLLQQRQDLRESISSTKEAIRKIDQESKTRFLETLTRVNRYFQETFQILFEGGQAEIKLLEPDNPLESGVEIIAQPPGKQIQKLSLLSGGEKSLTSLAFLFALFKTRPAPFCLLDEVDAALDETNIGRFLNLMKQSKDQTQFILITHNFKTMEVADYIYGTTMAEPNVTSLYSLELDQQKLNQKEKL